MILVAQEETIAQGDDLVSRINPRPYPVACYVAVCRSGAGPDAV